LLIVGDGPIRSDLEKTVANNGLSGKVTITGRQVHEMVRFFVAAMDIAVSPLSTFYASPMKIIEYMAMGKALVAPNTPNIRDIVTHEEDGILFYPQKVDDLIQKLLFLIGDCHLRGRLGFNARSKIESRYTWQRNAKHVVSIIENGEKRNADSQGSTKRALL
jgi:glycosyltransferase involved in cell wall biosynthesis